MYHTLDRSSEARVSIKMPKLPPFCESKDGMDAYLQRYERYAENAGWHRDDYALGLTVC